MTATEGRSPTGGEGADANGLHLALVVEQLRRSVAGGVGTYARGLLLGLASRAAADPGIEIELLASRPPRPVPDGCADRVGPADPIARFGRVRASPLPSWALTRAWDAGLAGVRGTWDLVHATSFATPALRRGRDGHRPPLVVKVHDHARRRHPAATTSHGRRWHEAALARALRRACAFVVPSDPVAADLIEAGAPPRAVHVVAEGADHLPPPDEEGADALRRRHGIEGPYLLSVSTLEPRKNLARLVAAYEAARPSLPEPWPLVVVGPLGWGDPGVGPDAERGASIWSRAGGPGPTGIAAHLRRWRAGRSAPARPAPLAGAPGADVGAAPGVIVVGPVSDGVLAGLYAGARTFAYVPLTEGFGLPPLEAMSFGVPVVTSSGVPSTAPARPGASPAAIRVPPDDVDAIAGALVEASCEPGTRAALGAAGLELALGLTWRRAADAHVALWQSVSG